LGIKKIWAKNLQKATSFFLKGNILLQFIFFKKTFEKNQKLIFKENIATIITPTSDYNFEETSKNVSLKHSKLV
jgi:hypothetical protein